MVPIFIEMIMQMVTLLILAARHFAAVIDACFGSVPRFRASGIVTAIRGKTVTRALFQFTLVLEVHAHVPVFEIVGVFGGRQGFVVCRRRLVGRCTTSCGQTDQETTDEKKQ